MYRCQFCSTMIPNGGTNCPLCHSTQIDAAELRDSPAWAKRTREALRGFRVPFHTKTLPRVSAFQQQAQAELSSLTAARQRAFGRRLV